MSEQTSQEPTMEEILASIRRIISEDDAPAEGAAAEAEPEAEPAQAAAPAFEPEPEPERELEEEDEVDHVELDEAVGVLDEVVVEVDLTEEVVSAVVINLVLALQLPIKSPNLMNKLIIRRL